MYTALPGQLIMQVDSPGDAYLYLFHVILAQTTPTVRGTIHKHYTSEFFSITSLRRFTRLLTPFEEFHLLGINAD
jgi:hypothetical protein